MRNAFIFAAVLSAALALSPPPSQAQTILADQRSYLDFGLGSFNALWSGESRPLPEALLEFRYGQKLLFLGPGVGIMANNRGGWMVYGGLYGDVAFGPIVVTPFGGIGGYHRGNGKDLGSVFEFRASLAARYELKSGARVGLQFAHVSNAYTGRINPGDEELLITYAVPLGF